MFSKKDKDLTFFDKNMNFSYNYVNEAEYKHTKNLFFYETTSAFRCKKFNMVLDRAEVVPIRGVDNLMSHIVGLQRAELYSILGNLSIDAVRLIGDFLGIKKFFCYYYSIMFVMQINPPRNAFIQKEFNIFQRKCIFKNATNTCCLIEMCKKMEINIVIDNKFVIFNSNINLPCLAVSDQSVFPCYAIRNFMSKQETIIYNKIIHTKKPCEFKKLDDKYEVIENDLISKKSHLIIDYPEFMQQISENSSSGNTFIFKYANKNKIYKEKNKPYLQNGELKFDFFKKLNDFDIVKSYGGDDVDSDGESLDGDTIDKESSKYYTHCMVNYRLKFKKTYKR